MFQSFDIDGPLSPTGEVTKVRENGATSGIGVLATYGYDPATSAGKLGIPTSVAYDNIGRLTSASQTGNSLSFTYDALSRKLSETGPQGTVDSDWDLAGRRSKLTYPGTGLYLDYDRLVTGEVTAIRENGATSGPGILASYTYDDLGNRTAVAYGNGTGASYSYDPVGRLASLADDLTGTASDLTITINGYNPASQITSQTRSNDAFAWTGHGSGSTAYSANKLDLYTSVGGATPTYDANGNLTFDPANVRTYSYTSQNLLTGVTATGVPSTTLTHDPQMRLYEIASTATTRFAYDGIDPIAEYDGSDVLQRRYVFGPGTNEPIVQYEGSGTTARYWFHSDERGSVVAMSDGSGNAILKNTYDEYGKPGAANGGRFMYTGQMYLPEAAAYWYKARMYEPALGRFLQTDPIGYDGGMNLYAYVGNDPVNLVDPLGTVQMQYLATFADHTTCNFYADESGVPTNVSCSGGSTYGYLSQINDYIRNYGLPGDIIVTANRPTGEDPFYFTGSGYAADPLYEKPPYSDAVDYAVGCLAVCPLAGGGAIVAAPEAATAAFARGGVGFLNRNNYLRLGYGWKGSSTAGRDVFRLSIGHKSWNQIDGLPPFPWHIP